MQMGKAVFYLSTFIHSQARYTVGIDWGLVHSLLTKYLLVDYMSSTCLPLTDRTLLQFLTFCLICSLAYYNNKNVVMNQQSKWYGTHWQLLNSGPAVVSSLLPPVICEYGISLWDYYRCCWGIQALNWALIKKWRERESIRVSLLRNLEVKFHTLSLKYVESVV